MNKKQENLYNKLIEKYNFSPAQLNQIKMGLIFDLDVTINKWNKSD